jgi:protein PsiE
MLFAVDSEPMHRITRFASNLHTALKDLSDAFGRLLVDTFHYLALFALGATTVWSAVAAFLGMVQRGRAELPDILLLFIYLEIGAMIGIYFQTTRLPVRYLIYIAITALGRVLIELVGAEHRTGIDILVVSGAILLLSFAVLVLRFGSSRFPSNGSVADFKSSQTALTNVRVREANRKSARRIRPLARPPG